jgi:hypothetical protein
MYQTVYIFSVVASHYLEIVEKKYCVCVRAFECVRSAEDKYFAF